ncbi:MAG: 5-(carboxyamino)imidazole ribonucleotide synthase [Ignavibacteria bacterium GWF2_33_9]|nr:MAG: 5-(carboxyamino)imidazole ribonucleotide synthase [Ignavibacteria bacterium GWF2_33_9]
MQYPITLGVLGGGQLAKMLASEAYRMGMNISIIENGYNSPAGEMTKSDFGLGWNNREELDKFIDSADLITLENEFIDPDILEYIEQSKPVFPSAKTLRQIQDKFIQKTVFSSAGVAVPEFEKLDTLEDTFLFGEKHGFPYVIKSRKMGYDGYGNATIYNNDDAKEAWDKFKATSNRSDLYAEEFVDFTTELAVMIARNQSGEVEVYPVVETIQRNHICNEVIAPARIPESAKEQAIQFAKKCVETIDGIGIFGIEFFLTNDNQILVNEIAPRPHNTGHYTIEACETSQYENAIRAVANLPLGSSKMIRPGAAMVNLLGTRSGSSAPSEVNELFAMRNVSLHLYHKKDCRVGRKMGHITVLGDSPDEAYSRAMEAFGKFQF